MDKDTPATFGYENNKGLLGDSPVEHSGLKFRAHINVLNKRTVIFPSTGNKLNIMVILNGN